MGGSRRRRNRWKDCCGICDQKFGEKKEQTKSCVVSKANLKMHTEHVWSISHANIQQERPKTRYTYVEQHLHIPSTSNHNSLPIDITEQRTAHAQDRPRSLLRARRSPERDISVLLCLRTHLGIQLRAGDAQGNLLACWGGDKGTGLLGLGQARGHEAECNGVGADTEGGTPFFGDGLGEADDAGFGERVVGLAATSFVSVVRCWDGAKWRRKLTHCRGYRWCC